jgi:hypothetical protein
MSLKYTQLAALPLMAVILASTGCSTTEQQAQQQQVAENPVDKDGLPILTDEQKDAGIICVREPVTGTRISKKTCTTAEQREYAKRISQEELRDTQRRALSPTIRE